MKFTLEERLSDSSFVERVWRSHSERTGTFLSQAKSCWEMVVTRHEGQTMLTVRGPETEATSMDVQWTEGEFVGIDFRLGTFLLTLTQQPNTSQPSPTWGFLGNSCLFRQGFICSYQNRHESSPTLKKACLQGSIKAMHH